MLTMYFYMEFIASWIVTRESLGVWGRWKTPHPELPQIPLFPKLVWQLPHLSSTEGSRLTISPFHIPFLSSHLDLTWPSQNLSTPVPSAAACLSNHPHMPGESVSRSCTDNHPLLFRHEQARRVSLCRSHKLSSCIGVRCTPYLGYQVP